ncbi:phosphate/phosphite/phosphonate ABC transporter substrate-binding protein [Azospirillum sp.]|uniref:phosphate/phosphite/phosphonate ABC transporter substrate-binding protein n=1 Tax=Azospirillum sp. TaxID=34012 RepID=UPI003D714904
MTQARTRLFAATVIASAYAFAAPASAQDCQSRGDLDQLYCDRNGDLVADAPTDAKDWKDPDTLVFTYTPVEDPAVYANIFKPFQEELGKCTGKKVLYFQVQSNAAEIEAMRSGRLHVAGFSTGPTGFAVNLAGAVPFAVKGDESGFQGYQLWMLVKADSPYKTLGDLKGKKIAHTSPSSNSGNLAPRALFPELGLVPEKDYQVLYSGKHDQSVMGVVSGDYDAAPVASDVYTRMVHRGQVDGNKIRVIYKSETFPTSSFAHAHNLKPELAQKLVQCFTSYRFPEEMKKAFEGADRFVPVTYKDAWAVVRKVADGSGTPFNAATYAKQKQ